MIELLAPAGDFEKLKIALLYGADAVFIGGTNFSLRARASNFTINDISKAVVFAHNLKKKVYVTTNIIPHDEDLDGLVPYLKALEKCGVDAIISASPVIIDQALMHTKLEIHLSTQQSASNAQAVNFWYQRGVRRIVLARELTKKQIKELKQLTKADVEVFIHGGMCMSFSGRCSLSNTMTKRDANRGGCAHSCRWSYDLMQGDNNVSKNTFSMSAKDLSAVKQIPYLIESGVSSLKIEGRMKSIHYIATVVSTYRSLIDDYYKNSIITDYSKYLIELKKAENRETEVGYLEGVPNERQQLFNLTGEKPSQLFIGLIKEYDDKSGVALIEQRNYFKIGDEIEVFGPGLRQRSFILDYMIDQDGKDVDIARHAQQQLKIKIPFFVNPYAMMRKKQ